MSNLISKIEPISGMMVNGYTVEVYTLRDGLITYGPFSDKESALDWANKLKGDVSVCPMYAPTWNRG